jgi:pimeloyl-ACP methyl ester carboxylesterase
VNLLAQQKERGAFPPKGDPIPAAERQSLDQSLKQLQNEVAGLQSTLKDKPRLLALLSDVQIFYKAVDWPLRYDEPLDLKTAHRALAMGMERGGQLKQGKAPWVVEGGVRAYVSKIDGSVQPYVVEMPKGFKAEHAISNLKSEIQNSPSYRLDFFFHGRDERLTELKFILGKRPEAPTHPTDEKRFLVYTYGRYCNANKFAGEIDTLEVLDAMKKQYPIDENKVVITGFSMGGAAAWHHAVHYADLWAAASPGAGFAETRVYQNMEQSGEWAALPEWQKKLHHWYDCTDYAANLSMLPTIAYAGELDKQRQSGDLMEKALARDGFKLERVVGPKTEHKYEPGAKAEIAKRLDAYADKGRNPFPTVIHFNTGTLRYNRMHWLTVDGLEHHWDAARVEIKMDDRFHMTISTRNVQAFTLEFPAGNPIYAPNSVAGVHLDGTHLMLAANPDGSRTTSFARTNGRWERAKRDDDSLRKRRGLQGPIDDAFLDSFLIVKPSHPALNAKLEEWTKHELYHASTQWRAIFRGEAREKNDHELSDGDIAAHNLVLFGDPSSNAVIAKIAEKLPIKWTRDQITLKDKTYPAAGHALILIYPNPLNPTKYVVLNSGFTFREADHRTNSRQIPRLPDYAVIDLATPPNDQWPGKVREAGFFNESWQLE